MPRKKNLALEIKQPTDYSCAPTCLAVALVELGADNFVFKYDTFQYGPGEKQKFVTGSMFFDQIRPSFRKTNKCSILDNKIITKMHSACAKIEYDSYDIDNSYSMPSGIADCLKNTKDIYVEVYLSGCFLPRLMNYLYPNEEKTLKNLNIKVKKTKPPKLRSDQRMLSFVVNTQFQSSASSLYETLRRCNHQKLESPIHGLHTVLIRPDNNRYSCLEPGVGKNYTNFWDASGGYFGDLWQLGVDMVITKT